MGLREHPLVLEVNTRCWVKSLSERFGRPIHLGIVPEDEIEGWVRQGFTGVWLMGVWRTGRRVRRIAEREWDRCWSRSGFVGVGRADVLGSPYAIAAYEVAEELGGEPGLMIFRERLNRAGLRLILDFIPNHVGLDHAWLRARPDLFVNSSKPGRGYFKLKTMGGAAYLAHGRDPNFSAWIDTVQLDYRRKATRDLMFGELGRVAARCDGVRCDMAMLVLRNVFEQTWGGSSETGAEPEFWEEAIYRMRRAHCGFEFIAEVYWGLEERLQEIGFDYTYYKPVYDLVIAREYEVLARHLAGVRPVFLDRCVHFLENHDEARLGMFLSKGEQKAAAGLLLALPGMRLLYQGQMSGARARCPVQVGRWPVESADAEIADWYRRLLGLLGGTAVGKGRSRILAVQALGEGGGVGLSPIVILWDGGGDEFDLVVINLGGGGGRCRVRLGEAGISKGEWQLEEVLGGVRLRCGGRELAENGLKLEMGAHEVQFWRCRPVEAFS